MDFAGRNTNKTRRKRVCGRFRCEGRGYSYHWTSGQEPHLIKNVRKLNCNTANYVPFVVPGLMTSSCTSSSPTSPFSSSQESVTPTEYPASTRSESTSEFARRNPSRESAEIENPNVPKAENFGDLITADHKVLSEGWESRNNHRYAVVVQDLATQWIQSYPCKTKTSQETQRSLQKFLEPNRKP